MPWYVIQWNNKTHNYVHLALIICFAFLIAALELWMSFGYIPVKFIDRLALKHSQWHQFDILALSADTIVHNQLNDNSSIFV